MLKNFKNIKKLAIDFETNDIDGDFKTDIELFSLAGRNKKGKLISESFKKSKLKNLTEILEGKIIIAHNVKFELTVLMNNKLLPKKYEIEDTLIMAHLLNSTMQKDLKSLRVKLLGRKERDKYKDVDKSDMKVFMEYNRLDSEDCFLIYEKLYPLIPKYELETVYELEKKVVYPIIEMERTGVLIDEGLRKEQEKFLLGELEKIQKKVDYISGMDINLNSSKQLQVLLYQILKVKPQEGWKSKTGYSTAVGVLETINEKFLHSKSKLGKTTHETVDMILTSRKYNKLISAFVGENVKSRIRNSRIFSNFNSLGTVTGRFSSSKPNLQQIPKSPFDKDRPIKTHIRSLFIAPKGWKILTADYSQIELVLMAELSQDKLLKQAFLDGVDLHRQTADLVGATDRSLGKTLNFAVGYGISPMGFSRNTGISERDAAQYIDMFFKKYTGVADLIEKTHSYALSKGMIKTITGRRRLFIVKNKSDYGTVKRASFNTLVQGSAADLMKLALILMYKKLNKRYSRMVMTVHDEVSVYLKDEYVEEGYHIIKYSMENALKLSIPTRASIGISDRWSKNK